MTRLAEGFPIEDPQVVVPWGVTEADLLALLPVRPRHVTAGYLTLEVVSLCGMRHTLGFHFQPRNQGRLAELEFFRLPYANLADSYAEWDEHLERTFGPPHARRPGDEGFDSCTWLVEGVELCHVVRDRFGPEELIRMRRRTTELGTS